MAATRFHRRCAGLLRSWAVTGLAVLLLLGSPGGGGVRAQTTSDAAAKARFTITLARFVQWPRSNATNATSAGSATGDSTPLRICVLHNSPVLGAAFAQLDGQRVGLHPIVVAANPRARADCDMLFVDSSVAHGSANAVAAMAGMPSLTLGAVDGFLSQGGMVELANVNDTLRFDVNLKALRGARLDLSSQVLKLARQVRD